jgi:uncharacterized coiled-coil protein SlyX
VSEVADDANPDNRTAPCRTFASDACQPLSLEELARPLVLDLPDVDEHATALREHIVGQQARLRDIERQYAEAEAAVVDLRRQLSEQEGRAADLKREYTEAETELGERRRQLSEQQARATDLEWQYTEAEAQPARRSRRGAADVGLRRGRVRLVLVDLIFALKNSQAYFRTGRVFRRQQEEQRLELQKVREAVFDIEARLRNLEDERARQSFRIEGLNRLFAGQETVIIFLKREIAEQRDRSEELMREFVREQHFDDQPLVRLARSYRRDPWWPELQSLLKISMLHSETLYLLRSLAARTKDAIIEVGPYIGGSTIALGRGLQIGGGGPLISVEMGGSYPSHAVPTNDIITDLKSNVEGYGLTSIVPIGIVRYAGRLASPG